MSSLVLPKSCRKRGGFRGKGWFSDAFDFIPGAKSALDGIWNALPGTDSDFVQNLVGQDSLIGKIAKPIAKIGVPLAGLALAGPLAAEAGASMLAGEAPSLAGLAGMVGEDAAKNSLMKSGLNASKQNAGKQFAQSKLGNLGDQYDIGALKGLREREKQGLSQQYKTQNYPDIDYDEVADRVEYDADNAYNYEDARKLGEFRAQQKRDAKNMQRRSDAMWGKAEYADKMRNYANEQGARDDAKWDQAAEGVSLAPGADYQNTDFQNAFNAFPSHGAQNQRNPPNYRSHMPARSQDNMSQDTTASLRNFRMNNTHQYQPIRSHRWSGSDRKSVASETSRAYAKRMGGLDPALSRQAHAIARQTGQKFGPVYRQLYNFKKDIYRHS
jgi:hypothetical protein